MRKTHSMLLLSVLAIFMMAGVAFAGNGVVAIQKIDGYIGGDTVAAGQNLRFTIKMDNTGTNGVGEKCDVANGFRIQSSDGAMWDSTVLDTTLEVDGLGQNKFLLLFSVTGEIGGYTHGDGGPTPDTVGTLQAGKGTRTTEQLPTTWNDSTFIITVYFHDKSSAGKHICIDSSFFGTGGTWIWVGKSLANYTPDWQGFGSATHQDGLGYCYMLYDPNAPKATIHATPTSLAFSGTEGGSNPVNQTVKITAQDGGPLNYNLNWSSGWLTTLGGKTAGTTDDSIVVIANITGLTAGTYHDSIQIASPTATNAPIYVPVTLTLAAKPKNLKVAPDTLFFTGIENGSSPSPQNFAVSETGGAAIAYAASKNAANFWLSLTNPNGNTPGNVTVNVNTTGVPAGTYFDSIVVVSGAAVNSPVFEYVKLTVTAPETKTLVTAPDTLYFLAQEAGSNPVAQSFTISEKDGKPLTYNAAKSNAWTTLSKVSGSTPDTVTVSINIAGLVSGTYMDSVMISSADAAITNSRKVFVKLSISGCPVLVASKTQYYDTVFADQAAVIGDSIAITSTGDPLSWTLANVGTGFTIPTTSGTTPSMLSFTFNGGVQPAGSYQSCFDVTTDIPVTHLGPNVCNSSVHICVNVVVKERPCVVLGISDTALTFTAFEGGATTPPSHKFAAHISDSVLAVNFKIVRPLADTWVHFGSAADTASEVNATNAVSIDVFADPTGLTPGTYTSFCEVTTTDTHVCEPRTRQFIVQLVVKKVIIPSSDTLLVSNVPGVPGAQVAVPVNFVNSCPLVSLSASLKWSASALHLDSVSYIGSRFAGATNNATVDNVAGTVLLTSNVGGGAPIAGGSGLLTNLYFSINPLASVGVYDLLPTDSNAITFSRQCSDSITTETPEYIKGGIVTDTATDYVCGWVVDPDGVEIPGATVQLFADFPHGSPEMVTTSTGIGSFAFAGVHTTPFDLYAYKAGYYPGTLENLNFGAKGVKIVLKPLKQLTPTSEWVDYFCATNTLFGAPLPIGSVVEAMTGNLLVGRWVVTEPGKYGFMPVYRANDQFGDNGAKTNDVITFFVDGYAALTDGNTTYPAQYEQVQVCLEAGATITKTCQLQSGWNLISWNIDTPNDSITAALSSISDCIDVVLGFEGGGLTYDPTLPEFSTLWFTDHLSGYWVKIKDECSATLSVTGLPVNVSTPIPVYTGWNLVSYLPDNTMTPDEGFASVVNNLFVAYGYSNGVKVFKPGQPQFNTLTEVGSCNGYWLKMNSDGTLIYPGGTPTAVAAENPRARAARLAAASADVSATTSWVNLYAKNLTLDGNQVKAGAVINAVSPTGVKVGSFTLKQNGLFGFMPVYSDAGSSEQITGLKAGDKFTLTVDGVETQQSYEWTSNGARIEVAALVSANGSSLPSKYSLAQNYPNPFNPSTTISFALPVPGNVRIEVYNVLGALVTVPFDGMAQAGNHEVVWDGTDARGQQVASGVYFYRLTAGTYTETKKMMLLK